MRQSPTGDELYRAVTRVFAAIIVCFGIVIIVVTLAHGGDASASGIWIGLIFTGLGLGRFYLSLRRGRQ